MATQEFPFDVYIKGPLTVGKDLAGMNQTAVPATLYVKQPSIDANKELVRIANANGNGLTITLVGGTLQLQSLAVNGAPEPLAVNQAGGPLQLGGAGSQVAVPGSLTVSGRDLLTELDSKLPNSNGTVRGTLTVTQSLIVNGRNILTELDGKLANANSTVAGSLTVNGSSTVTGSLTVNDDLTVKGRNLLSELDRKLDGSNNTFTGSLTVTQNLTVNETLAVKKSLAVTEQLTVGGRNLLSELEQKLSTAGGTVSQDFGVNGNLSVGGLVEIGGATQLFAEQGVKMLGSLSVRKGMMVEDGLLWIFNAPDLFQNKMLQLHNLNLLRASTVKNAVVIGFPREGIGGPIPVHGSLGFVWKVNNRIFTGAIQGTEIFTPP